MCFQALMLPEAVRLLHLLVSSGKRVYVHCTAGINRATLTTVGYLTFVKVRCSCVSSILHCCCSKALAQLHLRLHMCLQRVPVHRLSPYLAFVSSTAAACGDTFDFTCLAYSVLLQLQACTGKCTAGM